MAKGLVAERSKVRSLKSTFLNKRKEVYASEGLLVSNELIYRDRRESDAQPLKEVHALAEDAATKRREWLDARDEYRSRYPANVRFVHAMKNPLG